MEPIRILDIGDMQNGFMHEHGNLSIPGACDLIAPANAFLQRVGDGFFDYTLIVLDTHFPEEYALSEESRSFPFHCEYGTNDWDLAIDTRGLPEVRYLMKNEFSMWSTKGKHELSFADPVSKAAYENLFYCIDTLHDPSERIPRDEFIRGICPAGNPSVIDVTLMGVASDYCNRYAMEGWLAYGARVTILEDLTRGIKKETRQVLAEDQYRRYAGRLRMVDSAEYLREHS